MLSKPPDRNSDHVSVRKKHHPRRRLRRNDPRRRARPCRPAACPARCRHRRAAWLGRSDRRVPPGVRTMKRVALASLIVATLGGCATLPAPRPQIQPKAAYAAEQSFAAPVATWPADLWWHDYRDAQLDALIAEALAGSPSMAVARAR